MKNLVAVAVLISGAIGGASCSEDDQTMSPIDVNYRLLNDNDNAATLFSEGESFTFEFSMINESDKSILFHGLETEEFLRVYKTEE